MCNTSKGLLHNFTTSKSQLKRDGKPWKGAQEKDPLFVQLLIESFSKPRDVLLDCNASTGENLLQLYPSSTLRKCNYVGKNSCKFHVGFANAGVSIHACKQTGRHLVALKSDVDIFEGVLKNLIADPTPSETTRSVRIQALRTSQWRHQQKRRWRAIAFVSKSFPFNSFM
jgi:hypothetical protein